MLSIGVAGGGMGASRRRTRLAFVVGSTAVGCEGVAASLRGVADQVRQCATLSEVDPGVLSESAAVIVLVPDLTRTPLLVAAIRQFRIDDPATAMLLCLRHGSRTVHQLAALAQGGLDDFVLMDAPDTSERLRHEASRRLAYALPISLVRDLVSPVPHDAKRYCAWCYRNAYRGLQAGDVADWFWEDRATVNRHLRAAGQPRLHAMLAFARLLHVGYRLDTTISSIAAIATGFGFGSAPALGMLVKRVTGRSPADLRARGAVEAVARLIRESGDKLAR